MTRAINLMICGFCLFCYVQFFIFEITSFIYTEKIGGGCQLILITFNLRQVLLK
jgi:hypothetical protein